MIVDAVYRTDDVAQRHRGNPLIEALPPLMSAADAFAAMVNVPQIDLRASRESSFQSRLMDVDVLDELYVPPRVANELIGRIDTQIRTSYGGRNPLKVENVARLYDSASLLSAQDAHSSTVDGMILLQGGSGAGKSRLVRTALRRLPQGIRHTHYNGKPFNQTQVVWISVHAPIGGSVRSLMLELLRGLDQAVGLSATPMSYEEAHRDTALDRLIMVFAKAAEVHHLGFLHVDDLQRMAESTRGKKNVLQLIIQIANVVRCPVIFTGTPEGIDPLLSSLELARRLMSAGGLAIDHPASHKDKFFRALVNAAMRYQWIEQPLEVTEALYALLYRLSAGVTSIVLLLHKLAQRHALEVKAEVLTLDHYKQVYLKNFRPLHRALNALRRGATSGRSTFENTMSALEKRGTLEDLLRSDP